MTDYRNTFIRYDYEDINENVEIYNSEEELFDETTYFYHQTFSQEEDYDEDLEFNTIQDCVDLWEGNGYGIAQVIRGR